METLGLSGPPVRNENIFRRIFWPSSESVDADMLGQQGFWICLLLALLTVVTAAFQSHIILGILFGLFYVLGGIGVREHNVVAAISVATVYLLNAVGAVLMTRQFPGWLVLFVVLILASNVRGCWIASKWLRSGDPDLIPLRMNENWRDKLVDQMPARVWPRIRTVFYVLAFLVFMATIAGTIVVAVRGPDIRTHAGPPPDVVVHAQ
ncbi:MAG TPA: hypothetical protein VGT04_17015 [Acidobacteriaceae bacterium]|nr:hypothetical protein [Acidobacteriaceae bacterium]